MNRILLLLFLLIGVNSFSQSLRDSLFSGKLKADSALVAKSKIVKDSTKKAEIDSTTGKVVADSAITQIVPVKTEMKYSDNNKVWKKFVDEYTPVINSEMLTSKKIKKGGYTVTLEYEIGTDGIVTTKNIICDPKSEQLTELIRERMMSNAPKLAPQIVNGVPRKSNKRQVLIFVKEKN